MLLFAFRIQTVNYYLPKLSCFLSSHNIYTMSFSQEGTNFHPSFFSKSKRAPSFDSKSQAFQWLTRQWDLAIATKNKKGIDPSNTSKEFINNIYASQEFLHQYNKQNWYINYIKHRANFQLEQQKHGARRTPKKVRSKSYNLISI